VADALPPGSSARVEGLRRAMLGLTRALEGRSAALVRDGQLDQRAMERESLTREELLSVIHKQGFEGFHQIRKCELEPNGTFYVEAFEPSVDDKRHDELLSLLDAMAREIAALRAPALKLEEQ